VTDTSCERTIEDRTGQKATRCGAFCGAATCVTVSSGKQVFFKEGAVGTTSLKDFDSFCLEIVPRSVVDPTLEMQL
jgi:hypothetical protein